MKTLNANQLTSVSGGLDKMAINCMAGGASGIVASSLYIKALGYSLSSFSPLPFATILTTGLIAFGAFVVGYEASDYLQKS